MYVQVLHEGKEYARWELPFDSSIKEKRLIARFQSPKDGFPLGKWEVKLISVTEEVHSIGFEIT